MDRRLSRASDVVLDEEQDGTAWGVFQEVRGAWERIHATMRDALHPAMRRLAFFQSFELIFRVLYKHISTNRHTDTIETSRTERNEENIPGEVGEGGVVYYEVMSREVNRRLYMSVGVIH